MKNEMNTKTYDFEKIKSGDDESFAALCADYEPLLRAAAAEFDNIGVESDELIQEAGLALHKAALAFDPSQSGVTFGLYAKIVITRRLISISRREAAKRSRQAKNYQSKPMKTSARSKNIGAESVSDAVIDTLSSFEKEVLALKFSEYGYKKIAESLGVSIKSVDNAMTRIRRKFTPNKN